MLDDVEVPVEELVMLAVEELVMLADEVEVVAALTTTEVTKGLMSFDVAELARMFNRYEPGLIVAGTVMVACPLTSVVAELVYTTAPLLRKM